MLMEIIVGLLAAIGGTSVGVTFADLDQELILRKLFKLKHRSAFTHGPIPPLFLFLLTTIIQRIIPTYFTIGFCAGNAIHLAFDSAPKKWHGVAKISWAPWGGRLGALGSWLWLIAGTSISLSLSLVLLNSIWEWRFMIIIIPYLFIKTYNRKEKLILPTLALMLSSALAWLIFLMLNSGR